MFMLVLEKAEEPEIKLPTSVGSQKMKENSRKTSALLITSKPWLCRSQQTVENSSRDQNTRPASREICMQVRKQQLELDMEQQTGSKLQKEYVKAVYCHLAYLTYMQSTSYEMPCWMKHKLKSRLLGETSITSDRQMRPPLWQKVKRNWWASWWKWKRRVKKLA